MKLIPILLLVFMFIGITGCVSQLPIGTVVTCSDYHKVVDVYKTPGHDETYIVYSDSPNPAINIASLYNETRVIGKYIDLRGEGFGVYNNITPTNIPGYRDACLVQP